MVEYIEAFTPSTQGIDIGLYQKEGKKS